MTGLSDTGQTGWLGVALELLVPKPVGVDLFRPPRSSKVRPSLSRAFLMIFRMASTDMNILVSLIRYAALTTALVLTAGSVATASVEYGFTNITTNSGVTTAAAVASQLKMTVVPAADALSEWGVTLSPTADVLFVFQNAVGQMSSISEIYFADGTLMGQTGVHNSIGHPDSFTLFIDTKIKPEDLPAGGFGFNATAGFGADAWGNPNRGVDSAVDAVGISIDLLPTSSFSDLILALSDERPLESASTSGPSAHKATHS